mgnify:CR=1 FL=1
MWRRDHPRSRGEHALLLYRDKLPKGSSPLTRGALSSGNRPVYPLGIIPAHAGSTQAGTRSGCVDRDHPRSRGEHDRGEMHFPGVTGSSPLTRGAHGHRCGCGVDRGIIPAHAGSTASRRSSAPPQWDHPRSRGEHAFSGGEHGGGDGSSPLTRGAPARRHRLHTGRGIIPAHAGSTMTCATLTAWHRDHPRSRGEHGPPEKGSNIWSRIIPAHAGSTGVGMSPGDCRWDHPRSRGEHSHGAATNPEPLGSSPLTRGAPRGLGAAWGWPGIIPAHAGSTPPPSRTNCGDWDHPRSRGEHK